MMIKNAVMKYFTACMQEYGKILEMGGSIFHI